jgi:hypothetical protein
VDPAAIRFAKVDLEGAEPLVLPQLLAHCTHPGLLVATETQAPHIRAVLEPFERAGFHAYDLRNDYRWLLNARVPRPAACGFGELYARRGLVDVLLSRVPLAYPPAGA